MRLRGFSWRTQPANGKDDSYLRSLELDLFVLCSVFLIFWGRKERQGHVPPQAGTLRPFSLPRLSGPHCKSTWAVAHGLVLCLSL